MKIGQHEFKFKKDALSYYKSILNSYKPNQLVIESDFEDLVELIKIRPDSKNKIGVGIECIKVIEVRHKTKCFEIQRMDGSSEVFSYIKCLNVKSNPLSKFRKTCRDTISEDLRNVKLSFFKKHSSKGQVKCQETGELCLWEELNVDHRQPNTFSIIVDRFIEVYNIDINQVEFIEVMDSVYNFKDTELSENFKKYHKEKANLRLVKKANNLGRSYQARVNRQQKDLRIE
jgi:hypothetical protein